MKQKKVFVKLDSYDNHFVTSCLEAGVDGFIVKSDICQMVSKLARVTLFCTDNEDDISFVTIENHNDENQVCQKLLYSNVILQCNNWQIIPIENVLAKRNDKNLLLAYVNNKNESELVLHILENGIDGIVLTQSNSECISIIKQIKSECSKLDLSIAKIIDICSVGLGDRVCIDTITNMVDGQGLLVGDFANAMVLVNSESVDNEYVASRPFRVNAGAVHCYCITTECKTTYLSELKSGQNILIVDKNGQTTISTVGRVKCERRPMVQVRFACQDKQFSVILQNAETIRLVTPKCSKSIVQLKSGDEILVYLPKGARHFGFEINETLDEH